MDIEMIMRLVEKVSESNVTSVTLEEDNLKIKIEKSAPVVMPEAVTYAAPVVQSAAPAVQPAAPVVQPVKAAEVAASAKAEEAQAEASAGKYITSPIVGTFYAASSPDAQPYVKVGDTVKVGQVIGIVEAMKLMNEIESEVEGVITDILVNNQEGVEFGQRLFVVA